jgi:Xaa-Pro aminopeptidase
MSNETMERLAAVRRQMGEWQVDGLLLTSGPNYRWLSGFTGSACHLLITAEHAYLGTDFRYWEQARQQAPLFELVKMGRTADLTSLPQMVQQAGITVLGIEGNQMSVFQYNDLQKKLQEDDKADPVALKPLKETVESLRHLKSGAELDAIRRAAAITDWAMSQVNELVRPGMSEKALAWELEKMMRERGAEGMAFEVIVASGPNAALAHHRPSERPIQQGDAIVVDMGARLDGYHSDLTRSFYVGNEPDEQFQQVYNLVLAAQTAALQGLRAGLTGKAADALARDVISAGGHADNFGHSLGHGVGLYIHEGPNLSVLNEEPLPAGAVVTVEPGVYVAGWGGVRIEDLVLVTADGVELLSHCPKTPLIAA